MKEETKRAALEVLDGLIAQDVKRAVERARRQDLAREYYRRINGIRDARVRLALARAGAWGEVLKGG